MSERSDSRIPILDSLAHPTLTGRWLGRDEDARFETLTAQAREAGFEACCAIGMANVEDYEHARFMAQCRAHDGLVPVAGFDPTSCGSIADEMARVSALGYRAIKVHPRFFKRSLDMSGLEETFRRAADAELVVFYCTYMHCALSDYPTADPLYSLIGLLKRVPDVRMVLVHGGDVSLLRYAELVRFNANLLLDLSLTIMKYEGSSIDDDIRFLFRRFDRRICIGTDFPEYSPAELRARFEHFSDGISEEKKRNIGYRNLRSFLGLDAASPAPG